MSHGEADAAEQIGVHVLFFSVLRERVGAGAVAVSLPAPATGNVLLDRLIERYPALADFRPVVRLAVNQQYVAGETALHDGDEVALLTPTSGG
ncbi:MAG: MoaD/ThiS family protein [Rhodothermales bacterium]